MKTDQGTNRPMNYCGALNIDKPVGLTSRDVVDRVVRLVRPAKAGHAGTLDPLATGVLVVCVGHATRLINIVQEGRKKYLGRFLLGQQSDTDDITGKLTDVGDWSTVSKKQIEGLLTDFIGRIQQVPPQFSAVHVKGQRAYDLARRGETVEIDARPVDVFSLRLTDFQPPEFELEIECGSGTYVRSIGRDLGLKLGCGAVMTQLRRLSVGDFDVVDALRPEALTVETIGQFLQPALKIVAGCQQRQLTAAEVIAIGYGQSIAPAVKPHDSESTFIGRDAHRDNEIRTALISTDGQLLGIGETDPVTHWLHPKIIFPVLPGR